MHFQNGSPLSLDEQLCRSWEYEAFLFIPHLDLVVQCLCAGVVGMELLLLCDRRMHVQSCAHTASPNHDYLGSWNLSVYVQYVNERRVWTLDGHWDH